MNLKQTGMGNGSTGIAAETDLDPLFKQGMKKGYSLRQAILVAETATDVKAATVNEAEAATMFKAATVNAASAATMLRRLLRLGKGCELQDPIWLGNGINPVAWLGFVGRGSKNVKAVTTQSKDYKLQSPM